MWWGTRRRAGLPSCPLGAPSAPEALADRWADSLRRADGDDMTDDDLVAVLKGVARLAASAVRTGGGLYCWSF
ncbi:hypothetical protein SUDANB99_00521 [Streptomyces sp. enrichment culture]